MLGFKAWENFRNDVPAEKGQVQPMTPTSTPDTINAQ